MFKFVVQLLNCVWLCDLMDCSTPGSLHFTISQSLLKLMSIKLVMPSNHLFLCDPLLLLPSVFPSIRVFSSESALYIRWPKYWSFIGSISTSNGYSGLISFRTDWFDFLAVPGTLKSLPQSFSISLIRMVPFSWHLIISHFISFKNDAQSFQLPFLQEQPSMWHRNEVRGSLLQDCNLFCADPSWYSARTRISVSAGWENKEMTSSWTRSGSNA